MQIHDYMTGLHNVPGCVISECDVDVVVKGKAIEAKPVLDFTIYQSSV